MQATSSKLSFLQILLVVAVLITAAVHFTLGVRDLGQALGILFILNALGYIGLTAAYLLPIGFLQPFHPAIRWILMGYAALTLVLFFIVNGFKLDAVSGITKFVEVCLIILVWLDGRR
jgi:hypothetical protein